MEALEGEYEQAIAQDVTASRRLRERASREAATGRAILDQRRVWERLVGVRPLLAAAFLRLSPPPLLRFLPFTFYINVLITNKI